MFCLSHFWSGLAIALVAGCSIRNGSQKASRLENKPAPDFELTAVDGGKTRLSDFKGRPVLLSFFAYG